MRLTDHALGIAALELSAGLVDAELGGYLIKKRIRFEGRGKRGSGRTIIASRFGDRCFFIYGFAKNERSDISKRELKALQDWAYELLHLNEAGIVRLINAGEITEVTHGQDKT